MTAWTAHPAREGTTPEAVEAALLHDLAIVPAVARALPIGGLPQAGYLAQHCYLLCQVLSHDLEYQSRLEHLSDPEAVGIEPSNSETAARRAEIAVALDEILRRLERLYSADRPGGLDRIDEHLGRLHLAVKAYRRSIRLDGPGSAGYHDEGPAGENDQIGREETWWRGMDPRRRARIVAWAITAADDPGPSILRPQPRLVRLLVRLHYQRRATRRARLLGLERRPSKPE